MADRTPSQEAPRAAEIDELRRQLAEAEAALQKERDFAAAVLNTAGALVVVLDREGRIVRFNRACEELTGYGFGEAVGQPVWDFLMPPEEVEPMQATFASLLSGNFPNTFENYWLDRDGGRHLIAWANTALVDAREAVEYLVATGIDITERKRTEEALRWSARRDEVLSQTAARLLQSDDPQGVVEELCRRVMDLLDCHVFFNYLVDERAGRLYLNACAGIPEEEARKIEWLDYGVAACGCVAHDGERIIAEDISNTDDPRTALVKSFGIQAYCSQPIKAHDRLIGTLSFGTRSRPAFSADEVEVMAAVTDLVAIAMARIETETALQVALGKYRVLFESFPLGITISDEAGNIVETNKESERLLGLSLTEQAQRGIAGPAWEIIRLDGSPMPSEEYASVRALRENRLIENVGMGIVKEGGNITWINVTAAPIPLEGYGVAVTYGDISAQKQAEAALRENEERFRSLYTTMTEGVALHQLHYDAQGRPVDYTLLDVNPAFERITGLAREQAVGRRASTLYGTGEAPYLEHYAQVVATGEPLTFETYFAPMGLHFRISAFSPRPGQFATVFDDISEHKQTEGLLEQRVRERTAELAQVNANLQAEAQERQKAEEKVEKERQRFNDVLETLPVYVALLTPDYHATFANSVFRQRFGESHGQRCYEFLFHRTAPCEKCETYQVLETRSPHRWEWTGPDGRDYDVFDFPFTDTDGSTLILEMGIDITERKQAERALKELNETLERRVAEHTAELRETRDYLDNLLTYANAPIIVWTPDFRITRFNGAFERLTGLTAGDVIGKPLGILFPRGRKREAMRHIKRAAAGERWEVVEIPIQHVDGTVHTVLWNSATLYADDGTTPVATIAQGQDITERKQVEHELELRAARLANLARASQQALAETTVAGLLQRVVKAACELTGARIGTSGHGYRSGSFEVGATWRTAGTPPCPPEAIFVVEQGGVHKEIIEQGHVVRLTADELLRHPAWWGLPAEHAPLRGLLGVPLAWVDAPGRGLIMVSDKEGGGDFTAEDEALLSQLATVASLGLRHIQARTDAERRAEELNTIFAGIADGVIVYDSAGRIVRSNPKTIAMLGLDPQGQDRMQVVKQIRIYGSDGRPITREDLPSTRALRGETFLNQRYRMVNAAGQDVPMLVSAAPLYEDGQVAGAVAVWNDVTERDRLLDQVQQRAAELNATIAAIADGVVVYGTQGEIVHINALARELLGYGEGDITQPMPERIACLDVHLADSTPLTRVEEWPPYQALQGHMVRNAALSWQADPEAPLTMVLVSAAPIHSADGQMLGAVATFTDVSELRAIQQQLELVNAELALQAEKLERRNRNLRLLNRLSQELGAALEINELLERISRAARDVFPADGTIIWLRDPAQKQDLVCGAVSYPGMEQGSPETRAHSGEGLIGWVGQQRQSVLVNCTREDARFRADVDVPGAFSAGAVLAAPMTAHEQLLGVLAVVRREEGEFDAESLILVETLAAAAAIALENIHLHQQAREAAVLGERSRLARELHDAVSQTLFSASVIAESLPRLWEHKPERVRQGLEQLQQLTRGALSEMRALLLELRPTALAEGKMPDLLQQLVDAFTSRSRVSVALTVDSPHPYPPNVQIALYRIAQEALNNVSKHARATQVEVSLRDLGPRVELHIRDNGRGFALEHVPPDRLGLGILRERAEAIGAAVEISSQEGVGTEVSVTWTANPEGGGDVRV